MKRWKQRAMQAEAQVATLRCDLTAAAESEAESAKHVSTMIAEADTLAEAYYEALEQIREFVFARDGRRCQAAGLWDPCFGLPTFQHILKASQGGAYHRDNGTTLCAHHNSLIEADADFSEVARAAGLVKLRRDG